MINFDFSSLLLATQDMTDSFFTFDSIKSGIAGLISGGLFTLIGTALIVRKDRKNNTQTARSEIEQTYTNNVKSIMESFKELNETLTARIDKIEGELQEKEKEIENKNRIISELTSKADFLAVEIEKLMDQNKILINQNNQLNDKNIQLMNQNKVLLEKLNEIENKR